MFRFSEKNIYDRCGATPVPYDENRKSEFTGRFVEVGGEKIPIINYYFWPENEFSRCLCLQTFLGYIPLRNIKRYRDIFDPSKYIKDELEWAKQYLPDVANDQEKEEVASLSLALGKGWKNGKR